MSMYQELLQTAQQIAADRAHLKGRTAQNSKRARELEESLRPHEDAGRLTFEQALDIYQKLYALREITA